MTTAIKKVRMPSDFPDADLLESLLYRADMYQIPGLAARSAQMLCGSISPSTVTTILRCLGLLCQTSPSIQGSLNQVVKEVHERPELLRAVCMYPSSSGICFASRTERVGGETTYVETADSTTQTDSGAPTTADCFDKAATPTATDVPKVPSQQATEGFSPQILSQ